MQPPYDQPPYDPPAAEPAEVPPARWTGRARVVSPAPVVQPVPASPPPAWYPPSGPRYGPVAPRPPRRGPRWGRIALVLLVSLAVCAGGGLLAGVFYADNLNGHLKRTDPFAEITGERPPLQASGALNILMLGSDSRDPDAQVDTGGNARTDTLILLHIPSSGQRAYFINFPRDLWVHVPRSRDGQFGNTMAKINAAYAWGGVPLTVQTVEEYTGVRIDHIALIDFGGFVKVTDALGGVDMNVDRTITSIHPPHRTFLKGLNHFNGTEALDYVRQRKQFPDGDFARMRHQQEFLKALMDKAVSTGTVANPGKLNAFLTAVTQAMTVDQDFSVLSMALELRSLRSNDLTFMTCPNRGTDNVDGQSIVVSDRTKSLSLFDAVAKDQMAEWLQTHQPTNGSGG